MDTIGFGWSTRAIWFIALGTLLIPIAVLRLRVAPPKVRAMLDLSALTDIYYMSFVVATFFGFHGIIRPPLLSVFLHTEYWDFQPQHGGVSCCHFQRSILLRANGS